MFDVINAHTSNIKLQIHYLFLVAFFRPADFFEAVFLAAFFLPVDFLDADFLPVDFLAADFFTADFLRLADFLVAVFLDDVFRAAVFLVADFVLPDFFFGTLAPSFLASESPIAIACFLDVTFFPLLPLFNCPRFFSCMARSTFSPARFEYFAISFHFKI